MTMGVGLGMTGTGEKILRCAQNDSGRRLGMTMGVGLGMTGDGREDSSLRSE